MPREYRTFTIEDYEITKDGKVINKHTGRVLKQQKNGKGYYRVCIGKKLLFVHRLVAEKYVPNPDNLPQVNHKDGDKLNNRADNLEWVSNQQNRAHAVKNNLQIQGERCPWAKLTQKQVDFIREHADITDKQFAELFDVAVTTIKSVRYRHSWKR